MKRFRSSKFVFVVLLSFLSACGGGPSPEPGHTDQPPIVVSMAATGTTTNATVANASVNPNGNATNAWFEWGTSSTLATFTATANQPIAAGVSSVSVTANLTGLSAGTTYYYRVCGSSSAGENKGLIVPFITGTLGNPPTVQTLGATGTTTNATVANGSVNPNGYATNAWFEWGTSSTLATFTATANQPIAAGVSSVSVTANLTGLSAGTTYYYRVCGSSSAGENKGLIVSFTTSTPNLPPTVQTLGATGTTTNATVANGSVNPNGYATNAWFEWGTSSTLATFTATANQPIAAGVSSVSVTANLTGLSAGTTYYYRVCGSSSAGENKGLIVSFTTSTPNLPPTVQTLGATGTTTNATVANGSVNPNGYATNAWFEWGTSSTLATFTATANQPIAAGVSSVSVTANLTGLSAGTTYYYRVCGSSSAGESKGDIISFITLLAVLPPTATTGASSNITTTTATVSGTVNPNGADTTVFVFYGTNPDPSGAQTTPSLPVGSGRSDVPVSFNLTGLQANTKYYYKVVANNSEGADNGSAVLSFTTLPNTTTTATINCQYDLSQYGDEILVFRNYVKVAHFDKTTPLPVTYVGSTGSYQFIFRAGTLNMHPYLLEDGNGNNVFDISEGGTLNIVSGSPPFTGSGFTPRYEAPVNVSGTWNPHEVVDQSTNGNVPVGSSQDRAITVNQNGSQLYYIDPNLGTLNGVANGRLVYFSQSGTSDPIWWITWQETWIVNSAGTAFTGDGLETWQARSGTDNFYVHWNATATR